MPATPTSRHGCPGDCGETVAQSQLACRACWPLLPAPLRDRINTAYRARRIAPFDAERVTAHRRVLAEALDWYRANPPGRRRS
ncbi:hypothetical protein [Dactylosporangium sp. NPDC000521]|uniref:hypothetical protein n=1 Tax=Dactylosporangium sp. NPDC000521 TaxID=3363975 RepID=UPI0036BC1A5D